ncbi:MAG: UvrD-helicase domain-containing protein [Anaerolineaceae bacterium]|nr:UvrD-helicase domain-containing protein [Anaerolineaceae bacterium]
MSDRSDVDLLDFLGLIGKQREAVAECSSNVAVTAGAGSGKTRTLVARYLRSLSEGKLPRQVVAITFTEKAAREMRSRIRMWLRQLVLNANNSSEQNFWALMDSQMDSARIGTIHSVCAEILRNHPAEAQLDPQFVVVEENHATVLRTQAVENALIWAIQQPELIDLLQNFSLNRLRGLTGVFMEKRLEITPESFTPDQLSLSMRLVLNQFFQDEMIISVRGELHQAQVDQSLVADTGERFANQVAMMLTCLDSAEDATNHQDPTESARLLYTARRTHMMLNIGPRVSKAKDAVKALREQYDTLLQPWLGGAKATDPPPDPEIDRLLANLSPLLEQLYTQALTYYRAGLDEKNGLDFDDLESGAVALLRNPIIRAHWQQEAASVLVDEFQDTNSRQREIILGLCGEQPGRLFVVGDARQSIYRFRGADVTVFTGLQTEIRHQGGRSIDLDRTFRAHPALLESTGALLAPIMGTTTDPQRPFAIPFTRQYSERSTSRPGMQVPFVECILASGEDSEKARPLSAHALARRIVQLKEQGEILSWDEVALLFRASTSFPIYEQALEDFGVPFLTIAGSGFYERPEVRDLLNILRALADPWDDQALVGMLRSPAFGISDVGLYILRQSDPSRTNKNMPFRPLREALNADLSSLSTVDQVNANRALQALEDLEPFVDRLPVAGLLKRIVDRLDYRATLATCAHLPGSARLWRNVDKLISDAQKSGTVRVRAFLEYVTTMRDVGARESEAASEAEGVVRLMTIHKSKGLEFPIVVLADANRRPNHGRGLAFQLGKSWTYGIDKVESSPLAFRLAQWQNSLQEDAEAQRLLYVALTRAQEKLIINGHLSEKDGNLKADGWLNALLDAGGILPNSLLADAGIWKKAALIDGAQWGIWMEPVNMDAPVIERPPTPIWPESLDNPIHEGLPVPLIMPRSYSEHRSLSFEPTTPPGQIVGQMVHKALQRWRFPDDPLLEPLMRTQAQMEGLLDDKMLNQAIHKAKVILERFQRHPLFSEIDSALERRHELPYISPATQEDAGWGFMDCLYRTAAGWVLIDFKTDELRSQAAIEEAVNMYSPQLLHYRQAATALLGKKPLLLMCFLNANQAVAVLEIDPNKL